MKKPGVFFFALWALVAVAVAQLPIDSKSIDELANKDFKWWFAAVLVLFILSGMFMFNLLMKQLNEQRVAHTASVSELINYLKTDRVTGTMALQDVTKCMERVTLTLEKLDKHLNSKP